jgi:hypothetical protein
MGVRPQELIAQLALMQYVLGVLVVIAAGPVHPRPLLEGLENDLIIGRFTLR